MGDSGKKGEKRTEEKESKLVIKEKQELKNEKDNNKIGLFYSKTGSIGDMR